MTRHGRVHWEPLDGLRAVAVLVVVAFHLGIGWAPAGFLGVDLFFVISGFLITTLLVAERDRDDRVDVRAFWSRRIRRLVPAAVVMIAATTLATRVWMVEEMWASVRRDALASLAWVANWRYIADGTGYFEQLLGPSPLEHTWSLAVEEQFYLIWPVVMIVLLSRWRRHRRAVLVGLCAAAVTSAWWMAVLYDPAAPDRAYQGTDTRAQHVLVGAALAWIIANWPTGRFVTSIRHRAVVWPAALLFVATVAFAGPSSSWLFDGGFLAVSLLGAVLVGACAVPDGGALRVLATSPMVAIGRRSYGLYLWHWPVIVFVGAPMGIELSRWPLVGLQLAVTALLTEASYRFVEYPVRRTDRRRRAVAGWVGAGALCAVGGLLVLSPPGDRVVASQEVIRPRALTADRGETATDDDAARELPSAPSTTDVPRNAPVDASVPRAAARAPDPGPASGAPALGPGADSDPARPEPDLAGATVAPAPDPTPMAPVAEPVPRSVLLVGDSTALTLTEAAWFMGDSPWHIDAQARSGCHVTQGIPIAVTAPDPPPLPDACARWRDEWAESLAAAQPDLVIVSIGPWEMLDHRVGDVEVRFPTAEWQTHVRAGLDDMLSVVRAPDRTVVLLRVPCLFDRNETTRDRNDPARVAAFNQLLEDVAIAHPDVHTAPLDTLLCPDPDPDGIATDTDIRFDGLHVTPAGGALVWQWLFDDPWLDRAQPS